MTRTALEKAAGWVLVAGMYVFLVVEAEEGSLLLLAGWFGLGSIVNFGM